MASMNIYSPPIMNQIENIEEWLRELEIWECVTNLQKKKQGPALPDKMPKCGNNIPVHNLNKDGGLDILIS